MSDPFARSFVAVVATMSVAVPFAVPSAFAAEGGWTARAALQRSLSSVDYRKTVGVGVGPPAAATVADDRARGPADALEASVGYRFFAAPGLYLAAELGGALYSRDSAGFLRGTGYGERDVWPGAWTLGKRFALSLAARLGYAPEPPGSPGNGVSPYLFAETGRLRVDMDATHVNPARGIAGQRRASDTVTPRRVGAGVEFGGAGGRFDLRLGYTAWETAFGVGGGALADPRLDYRFEAREWSLSVGWIVAIGD